MKTKFYTILLVMCCSLTSIQAQWVVSDPTNLMQSITNTINQMKNTTQIAGSTLDGFKETQKIFEQGKEYYDALKAVNNLVKDAKKVQQTLLMVGDITEI